LDVQEKTVRMDQKIFDHAYIEPEEFRVLMIQPFKDVKKYMAEGKLSRRLNRD